MNLSKNQKTRNFILGLRPASLQQDEKRLVEGDFEMVQREGFQPTLTLICCILILMFLSISPASGQVTDPELTNYKSGIDVWFAGNREQDYDEEYFFHDKLIDDHKVVYLKSGTLIHMGHNERNKTGEDHSILAGLNGEDGIPNSGDEGIIRYRIDHEMQWKNSWASYSGQTPYPAYTAPFSLASLEYEPGVPIVGTTGPVPNVDVTDRVNYYTRGLTGPHGDEWHVLAYADDDSWAGPRTEWWSSDGKTVLFVVDPKTPCISFTPSSADSQFYTTPAKNYFIPVIHDQTTYFQGGVDIKLTNIMGGDIHYRFNDSPFEVYSGPINTSGLADGVNSIEYYYDPAYKKTRILVKNPTHPSEGETLANGNEHGYLLWENEAAFVANKNRCIGGSFTSKYSGYRNNEFTNRHDLIAESGMVGKRVTWGGFAILLNSVVVAFEGAESVPAHANAAKQTVLESALTIDPVGYELYDVGTPVPCRERFYRGYYDFHKTLPVALSYDLLIKHYRSDQHEGGITPIEDYKLRDLIASNVMLEMMGLGGWDLIKGSGVGPTTNPGHGMWDSAREMGAAIAALSIPHYDTPYLGTSGFGGVQTEATHPWTPYPDYPKSWKDVFYNYTSKVNDGAMLNGYPNHQYLFNWYDGGLITDVPTVVNRTLTNGTFVESVPPGSFYDRKSYYASNLMGNCFQIFGNITKSQLGMTYPHLEASFMNANTGNLFGLKISKDTDKNPTTYPTSLLVNTAFEDIGRAAYEKMAHFSSLNSDHTLGIEKRIWAGYPYCIAFYDSDLAAEFQGELPENTATPTFTPSSTPTPSPTSPPESTPTPTPIIGPTPFPNQGVDGANVVFKEQNSTEPIEMVLVGQNQNVVYNSFDHKDNTSGIYLNAFGESFLSDTVGPNDWFLTNSESQNVILVDDPNPGPINDWMESGPSRSTLAYPDLNLFDTGGTGVHLPVKYGGLATETGGVYDLSHYRDTTQLERHVFFVEDRFFIIYDDIESLDQQSHEYGWTAHCQGTMDIIGPNFARFTKASGRSLDIQFFGPPLVFDSYVLPQILDQNQGLTNVPYFIAKRNGVGTQFLNVLYPKDLGENSPVYSSLAVSNGVAGKVSVGGADYLFMGQSDPQQEITLGGLLDIQASLVLAKSIGGDLQFLIAVNQLGSIEWDNDTVIKDHPEPLSFLFQKTEGGIAISTFSP